ncbi:hypothetical protein ACMDCR_08675 [Labrys okinawensis]
MAIGRPKATRNLFFAPFLFKIHRNRRRGTGELATEQPITDT